MEMEKLSAEVLQKRALQEQQIYWQQFTEYGYTLFFIVFALAALLMLVAVFLPRDRNAPVLRQSLGARLAALLSGQRLAVIVGGAVTLLFLTAISQQTEIDQRRGFIVDQDKRYEKKIKELTRGKDKEEALRIEYLYMPQDDSLKYISLGNTALAADYVWLTSQQYVSNSFRRGQKFDMLYRFYSTVGKLDPGWIEATVNAGKVLSALEQDRWKVERFYIEAITRNPDNWQLPYEAGRLFVVPPLDRRQQKIYAKTAIAWLETTLRRPKLPAAERKKIDDLKARLSLEAGELPYYESAAELLLRNALDRDNPEAFRMAAARDWLNAQSIVDEMRLQKVVDQFKEQRQRWPATLDEILQFIQNGERLKRDRFGYPMEYDAQTGRVTSRGVKVRRAIQAHSILISLLGNFKINHGERWPKDLSEFGAWVKVFFSRADNPPSVAVTDAIGAELNVEIGPLGPWRYNAETGEIILPDDCNIQRLYQNAAPMLEWPAPPKE